MKSQPPSAVPGPLTSNHWDVPIRVRLVPYIEFGRWLDGQLEQLVRRWSARAAPAARRHRR
ncbi:MAG: hypothetical protein ABSG86_00930 [Thermoguttaceae bacterium]|jgi:hypothetical protein